MSNNQEVSTASDAANVYVKPAVVHELKLETRAGSPLGPGLIDPLGIDPSKSQ